jgi:hypothetical protein
VCIMRPGTWNHRSPNDSVCVLLGGLAQGAPMVWLAELHSCFTHSNGGMVAGSEETGA